MIRGSYPQFCFQVRLIGSLQGYSRRRCLSRLLPSPLWSVQPRWHTERQQDQRCQRQRCICTPSGSVLWSFGKCANFGKVGTEMDPGRIHLHLFPWRCTFCFFSYPSKQFNWVSFYIADSFYRRQLPKERPRINLCRSRHLWYIACPDLVLLLSDRGGFFS